MVIILQRVRVRIMYTSSTKYFSDPRRVSEFKNKCEMRLPNYPFNIRVKKRIWLAKNVKIRFP